MKGGEAAQGTSGVVEAVTAGEGAIGYADDSQAGELGVAKIKVGNEYVEPTPEAAAKILEESPEDAAISKGKYVFAYELDRKTESSGTYPIVLVSYLIGLHEVRLGRRSGNRQGVPRIRDQPRRPGGGGGKRGLCAALRSAAGKDRTRRRGDRNVVGRIEFSAFTGVPPSTAGPLALFRGLTDGAHADTTTNAGQILASASGGPPSVGRPGLLQSRRGRRR